MGLIGFGIGLKVDLMMLSQMTEVIEYKAIVSLFVLGLEGDGRNLS